MGSYTFANGQDNNPWVKGIEADCGRSRELEDLRPFYLGNGSVQMDGVSPLIKWENLCVNAHGGKIHIEFVADQLHFASAVALEAAAGLAGGGMSLDAAPAGKLSESRPNASGRIGGLYRFMSVSCIHHAL